MKRSDLNALRTKTVRAFIEQLSGLPFKKRDREVLCDGFRDGFNSAVLELERAGELTIEADENDAGTST